MRVLLTGASGFIGSRLASAFREAGHEVVALTRRPRPEAEVHEIAGDFATDTDPAVWLPRLHGIDAVVNAVGILRESRRQPFSAFHAAAPIALFSACRDAGVRKVIQISALGADANAATGYHRSKAEADAHLASLPLAWVILQPSIVFGTGGASTRLFATLAALPRVPLPGAGGQRVQPVHVDDLVAACLRVLSETRFDRTVIPVVGPQACTVRGILAELRLGLGLGEPHFVQVPMRIVRACARLGTSLPRSALDPETLQMLERGNTAPDDGMRAVLGAAPRPVGPLAIEPRARRPGAVADWARLNALLPLLRATLALLWIASGVVSLGLYPVSGSYALLERAGITGAFAPVALYGAALLDVALGVGVLVLRRRTWLWRAQMLVILVYTAVVTVALPELWLHPFGPVLKNVPLLAALVLLHALERRA